MQQSVIGAGLLVVLGIAAQSSGAAVPALYGGSCVTAVSPGRIAVGAGGASGFHVDITAPAGCVWTVTAEDPWIQIFSLTNTFFGTGSISLTIFANPSSIPRTGQIRVDGLSVAVDETGIPCIFDVTPASISKGSAAGHDTITVTSAAPDCSWVAEPSAPWLHSSPGGPAGSGSVVLTFDANDSGGARDAQVTIAGTTVPVHQSIVRRHPVTDFDGDGRGDMFLYNDTTGLWSIVTGFYPRSEFGSIASGLWAPGWKIQAADFNGDGLTDLFLYNPSTGQWFKAINRGPGVFEYFGYFWAPGWEVTVADFNGDGRSDLFLYNSTTGRWFQPMSIGDGDFDYSRSGVWAPGWSIFSGDFDGNGRDDLFLYNRSDVVDGNDGRWFWMLSAADGTLTPGGGLIRWAGDWTVTPADLNGDGATDLLLSRSDGRWATVTFSPEGEHYRYGAWAPGYTVIAADFNADDRSDVLLYDPASGQALEMLAEADGTSASYGPFAWAPGWTILVGDFDGTGDEELAFVNPNLNVVGKGVPLTGGGFAVHSTTYWSTGWSTVITR